MKNKISSYLKKYRGHTYLNNSIIVEIVKSIDLIKRIKKNKNKIIIFGNGGSQSIASHFQTDMIKTHNVRCLNFSGSSLLTCLSNDYGYEKTFQKIIEIFADPEDLIILISSSGNSKNIINAYNKAQNIGCHILTLTGFKKNNKLNKISKNQIWIDDSHYNNIENTHQLILLLIIDMLYE